MPDEPNNGSGQGLDEIHPGVEPAHSTELPEEWRKLPSGAPIPDWVAAVGEARKRDLGEGPELTALGRYAFPVTAKEKLLRDVLDLDDERAARARIVIAEEDDEDAEMSPLPEGWGETLTGEPMPNVAAAVRRSRESH